MFVGVNEVAIVVTALLVIAIGSIWYSPFVFGKHWMRAASLTDSDLEASKTSLARSLVCAFIGNLIFVYIIDRLILLAEMQQFSLVMMGTLLTLLIATSMATVVVWEKKSFAYLAIHTGYAALVVCVSSVVLAFWPW